MEYLATMRRRQDKEDTDRSLKRQKMELDGFTGVNSVAENSITKRDTGSAGNYDALLSRDGGLLGPSDQAQWPPGAPRNLSLSSNTPQSLDDAASRRNQETAAAMLLDSALANSVRNANNRNMPRTQQPSNSLQPSLPFSAPDRRSFGWPLRGMLPTSLDPAAGLLLGGNSSSFLGHSQAAGFPNFNPHLIGFANFPGSTGQGDLLQPNLSNLSPNAMNNLAMLRNNTGNESVPQFDASQGMAQRQNASAGRESNSNINNNNEEDEASAGLPMSLPSDESNLSEYQCLIRAQIELFEARVQDIECNAQGRNKPINVGQVGIRCKHCTVLPPGRRPRGAVYFPAKLPGLYQAAQNMAINHFTESCLSIPEATRARILRLKAKKATVLGGGKQYWANGARVLGIVETGHGLIFDNKKSWKSEQS
jgi:hypothetical protein